MRETELADPGQAAAIWRLRPVLMTVEHEGVVQVLRWAVARLVAPRKLFWQLGSQSTQIGRQKILSRVGLHLP